MQQPPVPPSLPQSPASPVVRSSDLTASPTANYEAAMAKRDELRHQQETLNDERSSLTEKLTEGQYRGANRAGLEARIASIDARIDALDKQLAIADEQVASAAAVPGAAALHDQHMRDQNARQGPPEEVFILGGMFIFVVFLPLSIAFARRIWRRGAAAVSAIPAELMDRITRIEQAVESIAIEVERVGEGQRFMTRVMTDTNARGLGAGPAEPIRQNIRDAVPVRSETPR